MKKWLCLFILAFLPIFLTAKEETFVKNPVIVFETNLGSFEITLRPDVAPKTCENFVGLVNQGYYNGITFHRVIKDFMVQTGDPTGTGGGGTSIWNKPFADECKANTKFDKEGILAMANRGPNTNGSQFFITTKKTPWLHMRHTIFGEISSGYDVVKKIESSPTSAGDRPVEPIKIQKAYLKE